jgi:NTP pyrophosphatase (non-canonical NTP hydrolase)
MLFEKLYDNQAKFEDLVILKSKSWPKKPLKEFNENEKIAFSKELALYLYQEIGEYVNAVGNYKMHKSQREEMNVKDVREEIADILIFAMDLALIMDMTGEDVLNEIKKKQEKNFKRQETGY